MNTYEEKIQRLNENFNFSDTNGVSDFQQLYNEFNSEFGNENIELCFDLVGDYEQYIYAMLYIEKLYKNEGFFIVLDTNTDTRFENAEDFVRVYDKIEKKAMEVQSHLQK